MNLSPANNVSKVVATLLLCIACTVAGCTDNRGISESPPVPGDPTRMFVEQLVIDVDDDLRAHAEALNTGYAITALLDREARRRWNARVAGGIKYADLFQKLYQKRQNHKAFARSDGLTPRGEAVLEVLAAADEHALDPAPYHIARIQTLASELERLAREGEQWEEVQLRPDEAEALTRWLRKRDFDPANPRTRLHVLDALVGRVPPRDSAASNTDGSDDPKNDGERPADQLSDDDTGNESAPENDEPDDEARAAEDAPVPRIVAHVNRFREVFARSARLTAELELRLADGALRYARDMKHFNLNRLDWRDLKEAGGSKNLIYGRLEETFGDLVTSSADDVPSVLEHLEPQHPQYDKLVDALARYRAIAADGGWERVRRTSLEIGARSSRVVSLRKRLAAEGYLEPMAAPTASRTDDSERPPANDSDGSGASAAAGEGGRPEGGRPEGRVEEPEARDPRVVDEALIRAIKSYQDAHQFRPTGEATGGLWRSINVPVEDRIAQIEVTLQRWRESRYDGEEDYVFVNIPDFHAEVYRDGERQMRFRVVTGNNTRKCDPETEEWVYPNATPVQMAQMDHLIMNPSWYVPKRIVEEEILPEVRKDEEWMEENNYEWVEGSDGDKWVRQKPGEDNALGRVKFIFPNPHNTYMHDTPKKQYFDYPVRAFSHGCVRAQNPLDFAEYLLENEEKGGRDRIDEILESGKTIKIEFDQPLPVFFEYYVVRVDDQGRTNFLADIYRLDKKRLSDDPEELESCRVRRPRPAKSDEDGEQATPEDAEEDLGP